MTSERLTLEVPRLPSGQRTHRLTGPVIGGGVFPDGRRCHNCNQAVPPTAMSSEAIFGYVATEAFLICLLWVGAEGE